jgi:hypothetical protein
MDEMDEFEGALAALRRVAETAEEATARAYNAETRIKATLALTDIERAVQSITTLQQQLAG